MNPLPTVLRLPMVIQTTGLAKSTIYQLLSEKKFPSPIKLSRRAVAWPLSEIERWIASRMRSH